LAPESDERQILRKMQEMSDGVHQRNLNRVFEHVSESFSYGAATRSSLRQQAETRIQQGDVTEIPIWDLKLESITGDKNAVVDFKFKTKGRFDNGVGYRGKAYFVRDPDRQWRLQRFEIFNLGGDNNTAPIAVPGL
jgi:hypothetical protein